MLNKILVLLLIVAAVKSQVNNSPHTDDYINLNRRQHASYLKDYDLQIETFKQKYAAQLSTIDIQRDMLEDSLIQNEDSLYPLEVLSDFTKQCVVKYRPLIPTAASVKLTINNCIAIAANQVNTLVSNALTTRTNLGNYYRFNFEDDIGTCNKTYGTSPTNYTTCIVGVASTTNGYTASNQKIFANNMEATQCTANANVKKAIDCSYSVENSTISSIAEANTMINRCLQGLDDCCSQNYFCSNVEFLSKSQVDFKSSTMKNPFLERNQNLDCLMLKLD